MGFPLNILRFCLGLTLVCALLFLQSGAQTQNLSNESVSEIQERAEKFGSEWTAESLRQSIDLYSQAALHWRKLQNIEKSTACLMEISRLESLKGDYKASLQTLSEALKYLKSEKYNVEKVKINSLISTAFLRIGDVKQSKKYLDEAFALAPAVDNPTSQALLFLSAGEFYYTRNEFEKTLGFYQKSLEYWDIAENRRFQGETLIKIAYVFMSLGESVKGLSIAREAEEIFQEINNRRGLAIARIAIGHLSVVMNESQQALESYLKAADSFPDDTDLVEKARLFNGIGSVYEDYGEWRLSLDYRQKALNLFNSANYSFGQLATLQSLVKLNYLLNNASEAEQYFQEIKKLSEQLNDDYYLAITLLYVGDYQFSLSRYEEAIENYQKSQSTFKKFGLLYWSALSLNRLGNCYFRQGVFEKASEYYHSSLEISRRINSKFNVAETLSNIGQLEKTKGNNESALRFLEESIEITENLSSNVINLKLKQSYFSNVFDRYELYTNLLMRMNKKSPKENFTIKALQAAEKSRARAMLENISLSQANFMKDADAETVRREKEIRVLLNAKADKLTDLLSRNADKGETDKLSTEIDEMENELENIKALLKRQSPIYSAIKNPAPFDVAEFQKEILDENSLLLEFSLGEKESYLWLIGKTELISYVLPPREQIEAKIQKLREILASRQRIKGEEIEAYQARIVQAENDYWQTAKELSNELFGQAADKFQNKRLIIVPDGKLNYFPVSALPLPNSETNEPILLFNEIVYEPSASTLSILAKSRNHTPAMKNLLVFSDPVFTMEDSRISAKDGAEKGVAETAALESFRFAESLDSLSRLPASKTEADSIVDILGRSSADEFSGFAASRERLLNMNTADYKILHFATHGLIDENRPELSGIVLSRFDENGRKLDEFVRLNDIYGMNLNSDLVVLSACETGIGKEVRGEGLQSLNNAFLQTGAKTVMYSLWKVDDTATLELMKHFYQALADEGVTPSQALQQAQINMWQSGRYKSPFYWAAFAIQGDFRRAPELSRDFSHAVVYWAAGIAALAFVLFLIYAGKRGRLLNRK